MNICRTTNIHGRMNIHTYANIPMCACMNTYVCMNIYTYVRMCIYIYICTGIGPWQPGLLTVVVGGKTTDALGLGDAVRFLCIRIYVCI